MRPSFWRAYAALDLDGNLLITGTSTRDLPAPSGFRLTLGVESSNSFAAKITPSGNRLIAGTFLPLFLLNSVGGSVASFTQTRHVFGTCRMGNDPRTSVADAWGRAHDLDNLYLADGSTFVTSGGFNPSLTIMALSLRMARKLAAKT